MRGPGVVAAPAAEATELFAFDEGECRDLARRFGTPSFVYRAERARARLAALRAALPGVRIAYAVKANPHRDLLALFAAAGASFDCASVGELRKGHNARPMAKATAAAATAAVTRSGMPSRAIR